MICSMVSQIFVGLQSTASHPHTHVPVRFAAAVAYVWFRVNLLLLYKIDKTPGSSMVHLAQQVI